MNYLMTSREEFWNARWGDPSYNYKYLTVNENLTEYVRFINDNFDNQTVFSHGCGSGRVEKLLSAKNKVILNDISEYARAFAEKDDNQDIFISNMEQRTNFNFDHLISHRVLHGCPNYEVILENLLGALLDTGFISFRSIKCAEHDGIRNPVIHRNKFIKFFELGELNDLIMYKGFAIIENGFFEELSARRRKKNTYEYFVIKKLRDTR